MSEPNDLLAEIEKYPVGSRENLAAIDKYIAAVSTQHTADQVAEAARYTEVGRYRFETPAPAPAPPPPVREVIELPGASELYPFRNDMATAETTAERLGLRDDMPGVFAFLGCLQGHERTPRGATVDERVAMQEQTMQALRQRCGGDEERAEQVADDAEAAVKALGLGKMVAGLGAENHLEFILHMSNVWARRRNT
jgi:hypothetical protein